MKLQGKNIILTGASRGFGNYLGFRLLGEGANVMMIARHFVGKPMSLVEGAGEAIIVPADLRALGGHTIAMRAYQQWSHIDGLVNNAAIQGPVGETWDVEFRDWHTTIDLDLVVPAELCATIVPEMLKYGHGKIVNISGGGAANPRPNYSAYATAKAGLVRFSECLAEELKGTGVDVNCVAPGKMPTGMLPPGESALEQTMVEAADLVIFLLSDESDGITGRLISAIWDNWKDLPNRKADLQFSDLYTLRRIGEGEEPGYSYHRHLKETGEIK